MNQLCYSLTPSEKGLLPSPHDIEFYHKHGWFKTRKVFSEKEIDSLAEASETYYGGHRDKPLPLHPKRIAYWKPAHGNTVRNNDYIIYENKKINDIICKPLIGAIAATLAQSSLIRVFNSALMLKPPNLDQQTLVPWHFDKHYWPTCTSSNMLTAFIPLHDCNAENGSIAMIDGSHLWKETLDEPETTTLHFLKRKPHRLEEVLKENARANGAKVKKITMNFKKGEISFHHCRLYHGSPSNKSAKPRRAISLHLQDQSNRYKKFSIKNKSDVIYNSDELCRKTRDGVPDYSDPEFFPLIWNELCIVNNEVNR